MQKLKVATHPLAVGQNGTTFAKVSIFSIYDTKPSDPHAEIHWMKNKTDTKFHSPHVVIVPENPKPEQAALYAAILRTITKLHEDSHLANGPKQLCLDIIAESGFHIVIDNRVDRLIAADRLKIENSKFWGPKDIAVPLSVKADSEEDARPLIAAALSRVKAVQNSFAKWVSAGMLVVESETSVPELIPFSVYGN